MAKGFYKRLEFLSVVVLAIFYDLQLVQNVTRVADSAVAQFLFSSIKTLTAEIM